MFFNSLQHRLLSVLKISLVTAAIALGGTLPINAFDASFYAEKSALAEGKWVKIGVETSGLYMISNETLRSWGFSDPTKVHVYGYGGKRIGDALTQANYVDDVPQVQCAHTDRGLVFYGVGAGSWVTSTSNRYHWDTNVYTSYGYYFLSDNDTDEREIATSGSPTVTNPATEFMDYVHHETDTTSPGEAGALLVGEDFRYTTSRKFSFTMPGRISDSNVWMECSFVAKTHTTASSLQFTFNGETLESNSTDRMSAVSTEQYYHGSEATARHEVQLAGDTEKLEIGITHVSSTTVYGAWLNYITLNYLRSLSLPSAGYLNFRLSGTQAALASSNSNVVVWDVTDPLNITKLNAELQSDNSLTWTNSQTGLRTYTAWRPDATIPEPTYIGTVTNQNLHDQQAVDMIIFTHSAWQTQAERLAEIHRTSEDSLTVAVVNVNDVYNEFASGSGDVSALRKYLKMVYDRSVGTDHQLKYALLLGRATYDNRHLTSGAKALGVPTIPAWMPTTNRYSLSDNDGYCTDDFIAMLDDASGSDKGLDNLTIAVGRIPILSTTAITQTVDKIEQYQNKAKKTAWKNRFLFLADDGDTGVHLDQTEAMINNMLNNPQGQNIIEKLYIDSYVKSNGEYPVAREDMFKYLNEGVVWWNFVGHASNHSWTHEGQLTYNDINNMYLSHIPFIYAATCDFLRWDSNTESGGEILFNERYGGCIGMISATRPVYISDNGLFTAAMGRALVARDDNGKLYTAGEVYRRAKNNILSTSGEHKSNSNRLRYVFMGDPALRLATPSNIATLDSINGIPVTAENQVTIAALSRPTISGSIKTPTGEVIDDFNGIVTIDIYDAEQSLTTYGNVSNQTEGKITTFETYGAKVYSGSTTVTDGRFSFQAAMPSEIANNFREATMSIYAYATNSNKEAAGINRQFFLYGMDESEAADTIAPTIETFYINHPTFKSGDTVNDSPMVIATISDNVGINLSSAGIGHQLSLTLDDNQSYSDVSFYYTPGYDEDQIGTINYPLEDLNEGLHTLRLRIWDTSGNSASKSLEFYVRQDAAPKIFDIYSDANPASTVANFYITHDRPDAMLNVTVTVYDLWGRPVWSDSQSGRSDMFTSIPISWDLTDYAGRRVNHGIYLYRASISTDNETFETASRRIAVTAR
jgi:hypothetical protein